MLHIILTILKIIGWIIVVILGLLVLLICVVLFVPLRYKAEGKGDGPIDTLWGRLRFSWLLHLVGGQAEYKNGKFCWNIRIAWKTISSEAETVQPEEESAGEAPQEPVENSRSKPIDLVQEDPVQETSPTVDDVISNKPEIPEKEPKGEQPQRDEKTKTTETRYERISRKLQEIFRKIKYTFRKICVTIKSLSDKKERIAEFLENEIHRTAFAAAIKEIKRLLRFLAPRKWKVSAHFGFEDPSITGYLLAFISMIHPFIGEHTDIRPDFEQEVFEGDLLISGKVRVFYFMIVVWNLFWNKKVRITYKHIRSFKL